MNRGILTTLSLIHILTPLKGMAFDSLSDGIFPDNYSPEAGETIPWEFDQRAIQYPRTPADSRDTYFWGVYIESAEYDPPGHVIVYIKDDEPVLASKKNADLLVRAGRWDAAKNFVEYRRRIIRNIPLELGRLTRVPVNIHVYKGEIVISNLLDVRTTSPILLKDRY